MLALFTFVNGIAFAVAQRIPTKIHQQQKYSCAEKLVSLKIFKATVGSALPMHLSAPAGIYFAPVVLATCI